LIVLRQVDAWPADGFLAFFFVIAAVPSMVIYGRESGDRDGTEEQGHCIRCGREVKPGEYVTAQGGQYAGRRVCMHCITEQVGINLLGEVAKLNGMGTRPLPPLEDEDEPKETG